ncbi:MAG: undecaprenyldiphospho-muramoylpentapeptide beta-N-acetylglucosaminyltransferase [Butyrivibrio sp.]|nr:undecaprenyldiphospho-muramoylpentapeptide beta-N-acetylglucosaminyltransferase [Butyrivibrio sp.]
MKKIILTGGGTAGHVTPNIALLPHLKEAGFEVSYIGSYNGIEKKLMEELGVTYYGISSGKFRRYLDVKNLTDPFRVIKGLSQAKKLIRRINPDIVFSKGGFVAVPVVMAAGKCNIPVIIHESDMTPGLANKLCQKHALKVCCNFPETVKMIANGKGVLTGSPIRRELLCGDRAAGLALCGFNTSKPVLMIIGGSLGAAHVNDAVRTVLPALLDRFQIIHVCGKGKTDETLNGTAGYKQFEYVNEELKNLFAAADVVISRAGANVICELLAMRKPNLLIPLPAEASRGDQLLNAASFQKQGYSAVLEEKDIRDDALVSAVIGLYDERGKYIEAMSRSRQNDSVEAIVRLLVQYSK